MDLHGPAHHLTKAAQASLLSHPAYREECYHYEMVEQGLAELLTDIWLEFNLLTLRFFFVLFFISAKGEYAYEENHTGVNKLNSRSQMSVNNSAKPCSTMIS